MSWHKKDWLLAALGLGGLGVATGGFGLLGGGGLVSGLLGGAQATTAVPEGLEGLGLLGTPMGETAMLAPPQLPVEPGLLDKLGAFPGSKAGGNTMRLLSMANSLDQQPQPQVAPMPRPQPQQIAQAPQVDPRIEELRKRRGMMPMGSFL